MTTKRKQYRILIVDDDRFSRVLIKDMLSKEAYQCFEVKNGQEAIDEFALIKPDLVLMDVEMPKVNGIDACRVIKSTPEGERIPVVFITSLANDDFIATAFGAGGYDYILKPVNTHVLFRRIERVLAYRENEERILQQNDLLNWIRKISFEFLLHRDTNAIMRSVLKKAISVSNSTLGALYLVNEDGTDIKAAAYEGVSTSCQTKQLLAGEDQVRTVWKTKERIILDNYKNWDARSQHPCWDILEATAALPMRVATNVVGVLAIAHIEPDCTFTEEEIATLEQLADLAALVVDNSQMFSTLQKEVEERVKVQQVVQAKNEELSATIEALKQAQGQMVQQEKMAGIGQLAAGIAHEINNPLGFVSSNFSTLEKYTQKLTEVLTEYRQAINEVAANNKSSREALDTMTAFEQTKKINRMLEDLPDLFEESKDGFNRIEQIVKALRSFSRVDIYNQLEDYNLNEGLETTLIVARNELKYVADVQLDLGDIPVVKAMGSQINQVLLNLLVNAAQAIQNSYNGEQRGIIQVRTFQKDNMVGCSIRNDGPPIPMEIQNRIFEPFFTTKPVGKGTGLGLSISYDIIVNRHKGSLSFISNEEQGTVFTLKIPITQE